MLFVPSTALIELTITYDITKAPGDEIKVETKGEGSGLLFNFD